MSEEVVMDFDFVQNILMMVLYGAAFLFRRQTKVAAKILREVADVTDKATTALEASAKLLEAERPDLNQLAKVKKAVRAVSREAAEVAKAARRKT